MREWRSYFQDGVKYLREKPVHAAVVGALVLAIFLAGSWQGSRKGAKTGAPGGRKILHYVDPMNPAHTSPEPGLAPCGMKMEPVYANGEGKDRDPSLPPGAVNLTSQRQQLLGVRVATVELAPYTYTLRTLGKVAVDETRIYRLNASADGWIRETYNNSTGSVVKKDETLATFYSPEFLAAQQAYIYSLSALDRFQASGQETPSQIEGTKRSIQQYVDSLHNLGMSDLQIREIENGRRYTENILMVAPATSFILARNVSPGQRYTAGTEWYRLADLSRVWVVADLFENEAQYIKPGEKVRVVYPYQKKTFEATVSEVLPQFDPITRTLKVRLETENPGYMLRPDMFVDVNFPIKLSPCVNVPVDAIMDSGLRQTVFVDRGDGFFEPRQVETGWRLGDRVEITRGLKPGEKIVISGNFLIDSESRMKLAAAGLFGEVARDPVCDMNVEVTKAKAGGHKIDYQGQTYYFCSEMCQEKFHQAPERYVAKAEQEPAQESQDPGHAKAQTLSAPAKASDPLPGQTPEGQGEKSLPSRPMAQELLTVTRDPVCHMEVREPIAQTIAPKTVYHGTTYYFCSESCKQAFDKDPERYLGQRPEPPRTAVPPAIPAMPPGPTGPPPPGGTPVTPPAATPAVPAGPTPPMAHPGATPAAPMDPGIERDIRGRPIRPVPAAPPGPVSVAPPVMPPPQQQQAPGAAPAPPPQAPQPSSPVCPPGPEGRRHD